jgi:hypothetical protein
MFGAAARDVLRPQTLLPPSHPLTQPTSRRTRARAPTRRPARLRAQFARPTDAALDEPIVEAQRAAVDAEVEGPSEASGPSALEPRGAGVEDPSEASGPRLPDEQIKHQDPSEASGPRVPDEQIKHLVIGEASGLEEESTGEHEVPAEVEGLREAFAQPDTAPGEPQPHGEQAAEVALGGQESWRDVLNAHDEPASIHDVLSFSDMNGVEIGRRKGSDEPLTEVQIDAIIQRTARLFQKRPEELGAVSIQQIGAREFQLGPSDIEQVVDALGEYKRAAAQRALRGRIKRAFKYGALVLLICGVIGGTMRAEGYMRRQLSTAAEQQYLVFQAMQERREAILAHGMEPETPLGKHAMDETKRTLELRLSRYDATTTAYNELAQSVPMRWVVWGFELPTKLPTSHDFNGLYLMGL